MGLSLGRLGRQAGWSLILQLARIGGNAAVFLIVARLLSLEEIGTFALAFAPVRWTQAVHKSGIVESVVITGRALPAGATRDRHTETALFWLSVAAALMLAGCLALVSICALLLNAPGVGLMGLALLAVPFANGVSAVPEGVLLRQMRVRALALRTVAVQLLSGGAAIGLALAGSGGWALVGFAIVSAALNAMICIGLTGWRPAGGPDRAVMRQLAPGLLAISGRALLSTAVLPALQIGIGLGFGMPAAGGFQIAQRVFRLIDAICLAPVRLLILPLMAQRRALAEQGLNVPATLRALRVAGALSAPLFVGTLVFAGDALHWLLGATAAQAATPIVQLLCLLGANAAIMAVLGPALTAAGQAGLTLQRVALMLAVTIALALPAAGLSVNAMVLAYVAASYTALTWLLLRLRRGAGFPAGPCCAAVALPYMAAAVLGLAATAGTDQLGSGATPALMLLAYPLLLALVAPGAVSDLRLALTRA